MRTLTRQKLRGFRALRSRRNPTTLAPAGVAQRSWTDQLGREKSELRSALFLLRKQLLEKGVAEGDLPTPDQISQHAGEASVIVASSQYADLAEQSKLLTPTASVVDEVLGFSPGGIFEKAASESLAKSTKSAMVSKLDARRSIALSKRASAGKEVKAAEAAAKEAELESLIALREATVREQTAPEQLLSRADLQRLARQEAEEGVREDEGDEDEEEEIEVVEESPKRRRSTRRSSRTAPEQSLALQEGEEVLTISQKGARLEGYANFLTQIRKTAATAPGYKPPSDKVLAATSGDILLYLLSDGTTQVWIKGALTEGFNPSRGRASWMAAKGYAKKWLDATGATGELKKSRLNTRVVFSTEDERDRMEVIYESHNARKAKAEKVPSFDAVFAQLREEGKKANPRTAFRNPTNRQIADQLRASFRRTNGIGTVLAGVGGFVAGTYAEAAFGLSKYFTRGGKATVKGAREVARAAQARRLPSLPKLPAKPKVKTVADFEPSARLEKMIRDFYAYEDKKKAVPFAQTKKREQMEARLDAMWAEIEALREQERAAQGIRSNPGLDMVGLSLAQGNQMPNFAPLRNGRKIAVPEYVAKTPRKMGERISAIGVKGKWPIGDLFHARLAAIYIMSPSHRAKKAQVLRALELNWPQYDWRGFLAKGEPARLRKVANPALPNQEQLDFLGKVTLEARKATEALGKAKTSSALRDAAADALDAAIEAEEAAQEAHESSRQTWRKDSPEAVVAVVQAIRAATDAAAAARAAVRVADARAERGERLQDEKLRMAMLARVRKVPNPMLPAERERLLAAVQHWYRSGQITEHEFRTAVRAIERGNDGVMVLFPTKNPSRVLASMSREEKIKALRMQKSEYEARIREAEGQLATLRPLAGKAAYFDEQIEYWSDLLAGARTDLSIVNRELTKLTSRK